MLMEVELTELSGSLEESKVPDLIFSIAQSGNTGVLYLNREKEQKALYFAKGKLVFAKSNSVDDRLGEQLLKQKKITRVQLLEAGKEVTASKRLGTILVEKQIINSEELVQAIIGQIKEIIFKVFQWTEGEYLFKGGTLPSKEVIILNIPTEEIIIEGIQKIDKWSWINQAVGDSETYYKVSSKPLSIEGLLFLSPQAQKIIHYLSEEHTVQQICDFSSLGDFEMCKTLWGLSILGIVEKIASPLLSYDEKEIIQERSSEERQRAAVEEALAKEVEAEETAVKHATATTEEMNRTEMREEPVSTKQGEALQEQSVRLAPEETQIPVPEQSEITVDEQNREEIITKTDLTDEVKISRDASGSILSEEVHQPAGEPEQDEGERSFEIVRPVESQEIVQKEIAEQVNNEEPQQVVSQNASESEIQISAPVSSMVVEHEASAEDTTIASAGPLLAQPMVELSFSDLSDLTDQASEDMPRANEPPLPPDFDEEDIHGTVHLFNEKQKYIYEFLRMELGTLANDFLFTSLSKIKTDYFLLFDNVKYDDFGNFNGKSLRDNIVGNLIYDFKAGFQSLLLIQLQMMEKFLEPERVLEINTMLDKIK